LADELLLELLLLELLLVLLLRDGDDDSVKDGDAGLDVATVGFDGALTVGAVRVTGAGAFVRGWR
jgi:hypothetical protein